MHESVMHLFEQEKWLRAVDAPKTSLLIEKVAGLQRCSHVPLTPYVSVGKK
jgi:hypothetical protein